MKQHLNTLYITREASWLSLDGETVVVSLNGQKLTRIPLHNLQAIQTFGWNIAASPQLMAHCAEKGIALSFCTPEGKFLCRVSGYTPGNVLLRRQQYRLADDTLRSLMIAREMIAAKILNARTILQRACRDYEGAREALSEPIVTLARSVEQARQAQSAAELLGIEGKSAERYFSSLPVLITRENFSFTSRNRRPPLDPVNALLSFVYTLLASDCRSALEAVGLDSAVGIYHRDRPGRPGLALDLMEELRSPLADRLVLTLLNRRQLNPDDFIISPTGAVTMTDEARRKVLTAWQERKKETLEHPYLQEKITLGLIPHIQARLLAQHIRGALDAYPPMLWK